MQDKAMTMEYQGPERRKRLRRINGDRRAVVRYEPDKAARRQGFGRRKEDRVWDMVRVKF